MQRSETVSLGSCQMPFEEVSYFIPSHRNPTTLVSPNVAGTLLNCSPVKSQWYKK